MTDVAKLLTESRAMHKQGRTQLTQKHVDQARTSFRAALDARLAARSLDPHRADPAWLEDLKNPATGVALRVKDVSAAVARIDVELEASFLHRLGEDQNKDLTAGAAADVLPPKRWALQAPGETICAVCTHPKHGDPCGGHVITDGLAVPCPCPGYVPLICHHAWRVDGTSRQCVSCKRMEQLEPLMAVEATLAFLHKATP